MDKIQLVEGRWLTANHICVSQNLLQCAYPHQSGLQDTHYLFENKWLSTPNDFVQIIFIEQGHWACLSNKFCCSSHTIDLYDSLHSIPDESSSIVRQACAIVNSQAPSISINVINCQVQLGGSDCGVFAVSMATDLCRNVDPYSSFYEQRRMRAHLKSCFETKKISPFPSSTVVKKQRILKTIVINLYCICRQPEVCPMVSCDKCGEWYHKECANISDTLLTSLHENGDLTWYCPCCKLIINVPYILCVF